MMMIYRLLAPSDQAVIFSAKPLRSYLLADFIKRYINKPILLLYLPCIVVFNLCIKILILLKPCTATECHWNSPLHYFSTGNCNQGVNSLLLESFIEINKRCCQSCPINLIKHKKFVTQSN